MKLSEYNQKIKDARKLTGIPESDLYCMTLDEVKRNNLIAKRLIYKLKRQNNLERKNAHRTI
jgi:hypothetical protein